MIRAHAAARAPELAASLIDRFGSLGAVLAARPSALDEVLGDAPLVRRQLQTLRSAEMHLRRTTAFARPGLGNWQALLDYLRSVQAFSDIELVRILYLDSRNALIREEIASTGSVDQAPVYIREILKRALELGACAIIVVHNHPSGDPKPSRADIDITSQLVRAGKPLGIFVHDHLIVTPAGHCSMKSAGLM